MPSDSSRSPPGEDTAHRETSPNGPSTSDCTGFETELAHLKSEGSLLLVVSKVTDAVHRQLCRKMLGSSSGPSRRRVVALTDSESAHATERVPSNATRDPRHLQVVEFGIETRSSAASASTDEDSVGTSWSNPVTPRGAGESATPGHTVVEDESIETFGASIAEAVETLAGPNGELEPQELRICVDSLDTLIDLYDVETVQRFLHILRGLIKSQAGLAHVHLPVNSDHPDVGMLAPLCDAVVEVREPGATSEYRLNIRGGPTSEWMPVTEDPR